ncbi:hypothetical protein RMSM_01168 [Rhodopirellula maiorica SM1]|uniref:Uncharacterized protein n=1 Tax=Rhodopirellula maiorica SM1 TaxID=1265738 RepID=M5S6U4_9BACT|nr:hypothetical protein RMSM_01168 [Rhodopirellula maiorica SM1]
MRDPFFGTVCGANLMHHDKHQNPIHQLPWRDNRVDVSGRAVRRVRF